MPALDMTGEMAGERPERDVLAEALHDSYHPSIPWAEPRGTHDACEEMADVVRRRLAARGYTLSKSAPDPRSVAGVVAALEAEAASLSKSAPDRPEPLPREALDEDGLCAECGHDDNEHVHYCAHETTAGSCYCNVEYVALSPDRPTPP